MITPHLQQRGDRWAVGLMVALLVAGLSQAGHDLEGAESRRTEGSSETQLYMRVRGGRLSVDLRQAEVGEVLARLAYEAGLVIVGSWRTKIQLSAQFTDVELEVGIRRLLRLASLSHAIRYAPGPTGEVAMQEVQVFGAANDGPPPQPRIIEPDAEERVGAPVPPEGKLEGSVKPRKGL
jgi:hypothetical protein